MKQSKRLADALVASEELLEATLEGNEDAVAKGIELAHNSNTSILSYNDENSLTLDVPSSTVVGLCVQTPLLLA